MKLKVGWYVTIKSSFRSVHYSKLRFDFHVIIRSVMMSSSEIFSLKWNDYLPAVSDTFRRLRQDDTLSDVRLGLWWWRGGGSQDCAHGLQCIFPTNFFKEEKEKSSFIRLHERRQDESGHLPPGLHILWRSERWSGRSLGVFKAGSGPSDKGDKSADWDWEHQGGVRSSLQFLLLAPGRPLNVSQPAPVLWPSLLSLVWRDQQAAQAGKTQQR